MRTVLIAFLLIGSGLAGCIGNDSTDDPIDTAANPGTSATAPALPESIAVAGAEVLERNETSVTFEWTSTAEIAYLGVGAGQEGFAGIEEFESTTLELPADHALSLDVQLAWQGDAWLYLEIVRPPDFELCTDGDDGANKAHCHIERLDPLSAPETWTLRAQSVNVAEPTPFTLTATIKSEVDDPRRGAAGYEPHVVVAVPDSGINPYHISYYRPNLTEHPCSYIEGFPCSVQELALTVGGDDYDAALEADKELWSSVEPGQWYWIPQTAFVAVSCQDNQPTDDRCILDDTGMHGTGTTSSVLSENPDARVAFREGGSSVRPFVAARIPVDIFSVSWGHVAPVPAPKGACLKDNMLLSQETFPIYVKASGNQPGVSSLLDCWSGKPELITVGGAYAADKSQESGAFKEADVVSYYCRPTAQTQETHENRTSYCGTSFAAPTVAGALSKVVLGLREQSGYTGTMTEGMVDPILEISRADLRDALNRTASYDPEPRYENTRETSIPLNPVAPWTQWGWGFYDGSVATATLDHLLGQADAPAKPAEARSYMDAIYTARQTVYG